MKRKHIGQSDTIKKKKRHSPHPDLVNFDKQSMLEEVQAMPSGAQVYNFYLNIHN